MRGMYSRVSMSKRLIGHGVALQKDEIGNARRQRFGVVQLGQLICCRSSSTRCNRSRQLRDQVSILLILFDVIPIRPAEHFPIEMPGIVPHRIFAVLGKLDCEAA